MHGILTRKQLHSTLLVLLTLASWCPTVRLQPQSANMFALHFPLYLLFHLGNILMEPFAMFIGDGSHVFREKNSKCECSK